MSESPTTVAARGGAAWRGVGPRHAFYAVASALAVFWLYQVYAYSVDVLYWDQWDFYRPSFGESGPVAAFLQQHGAHRLGLGGALTYVLAQATGFSVVLESYMILFFQLASAVLAVSLARRLAPRSVWVELAIVLVVLNPLHGETITAIPSLSVSVLPLFLLLLIAHCWISDDHWLKWALVSVLAGLSLFTGYGVFVYLAVGGLLVGEALVSVRSGARANAMRSAAGLTFLLLAGIVFVRGYEFGTANPSMTFPHDPLHEYPVFVFWLLGGLFRPVGWPAPYLGAVVAITVSACLIASLRSFGRDRASQVICFLVIASLTYAIGTAVGRVHAGVRFGGTYRYFTLASPVFLAFCYFLVANRGVYRWSARAPIALLSVVALGFVLNVAPIHRFSERHRSGKEAWVAAYEVTHDVTRANESSGYPIYPNPEAIEERVQFLVDRRLSAFRAR